MKEFRMAHVRELREAMLLGYDTTKVNRKGELLLSTIDESDVGNGWYQINQVIDWLIGE